MKDRANQNLILAFALSLSTILCVVYAWVNIGMLLFLTVVPFFCLQLLLLRLTNKLALRLVPVYPIALVLLAAGYYWLFGKGWDALAALILGFASIAPAVGCLFAALSYWYSGREHNPLNRKWLIVSLVLLGWGGAWLGVELCGFYPETSLVKALSFLSCFGLYVLLGRDGNVWTMFRKPDRSSMKLTLPLTIEVFVFLVGGYAILSPWLDLSAIPEHLALNDITAENFPLVAAYIILCNSLLEEVFFRGFAFLALKRHASARFAYLFSGVTFALYHVSIMSGWFHPIWFGLFIAGLAVGGMLFDYLDRRGSLWNGWMVHAAANLAINLIGMRMFGII